MSAPTLLDLSIAQMRVIGIMLLVTQVVFFIVVVLVLERPETTESTANAFRMIVPAMAAIAVPAAFIFFKKMIDQAKAQPRIDQRLMRYRTAVIVKLALLEFVLLFVCVGILMTGAGFMPMLWAVIFALMVISVLSAVKRSFVEEIAQGDARAIAS
ncbi:MAG TPA: hypothetical protein VFH43_11680 [Candidatus Kapabacteria bacterium]|nr:hypothetical protein [Candidatus Kapabacteria bacterium]